DQASGRTAPGRTGRIGPRRSAQDEAAVRAVGPVAAARPGTRPARAHARYVATPSRGHRKLLPQNRRNSEVGQAVQPDAPSAKGQPRKGDLRSFACQELARL